VRLVASATDLSDVVVVGSRGLPRTDVERPSPVDVLNAKELQATGQVDLGQQVQFNSPSFNSAKTGVNGVANYADPATLRGLSPDQVLVLVDGKRRHQFSALNLNVTVGSGTVVTDLNAIPSLAIERIEVLRDGAAAQYGSDAIAGVINLGLNKSTGVATARLQYGLTQEGDGAQYLAGANYGLQLGQKNPGYLNVTLQYQRQEQTNRSDNYASGIYTAFPALTAANPTPTASQIAAENARRTERNNVYPQVGQPFKVGVYGSNQADIYQGFYNFGLPVGGGGWSVYSFGGYSRKDILAYGFFRNAQPNNVNFSPRHLDGYLPELPGRSDDYSTVVGVRRKLAAGWNLDFSTGYGYNYLDLFANKTANPSMGADSPTDFYVGRSAFGQSTSEVNVSRNFEGLFGTKSFNVALGSQFRVDQFELVKGSPESYFVGPLAAARPASPGPPPVPARTAKATGSSGRPGIAPDDETNATRRNVGVYVDVESDLTERLLLTSALRYENYSDFGSNVSGKAAGRFKVTEGIALRGSVNRGFRAPSLQQTFNSVTTSTVQAGEIVQTKQLRNNDARLGPLGVADPKAETSWNYSAGIAARLSDNLLFTVDAYQIDIQNRIINSERLVKSDIRALQTADFANINEIRFFTNAINTQTRGIDLVTTYKTDFSERSRLSASLALTFNQTEISKIGDTPAALQGRHRQPNFAD
jgi:iron complex outermembrane receptor protein